MTTENTKLEGQEEVLAENTADEIQEAVSAEVAVAEADGAADALVAPELPAQGETADEVTVETADEVTVEAADEVAVEAVAASAEVPVETPVADVVAVVHEDAPADQPAEPKRRRTPRAAKAEPAVEAPKAPRGPRAPKAPRMAVVPEGFTGQTKRKEAASLDNLKETIEKHSILAVQVTHVTDEEVFVLLGSNGLGGHLLGVMPFTEFDDKIHRGYEGFVGESFDVIVTGFDPVRGLAGVSRVQARKMKRDQLLAGGFGVGSVVTGVIRSIQPYAAFVDVGGMHCILPINEISFNHIDHPSDAGLKRGDAVDVKVIDWNPETLKARVSMKALSDPWKKIGGLYKKGAIVLGEISGARDAQVWVRPNPYSGLEILCPAMQNHRYDKGRLVRVRLLTVDPENKKLRGKIIGVVK